MKILDTLELDGNSANLAVKVNGVQLHNFNSVYGETGLIEYLRTHYTREDGSPLTIDDIFWELCFWFREI
tara:strand:- start:1797 stop:2006 length:210 start_codon:yes stop_codon:yes gene_type:complete